MWSPPHFSDVTTLLEDLLPASVHACVDAHGDVILAKFAVRWSDDVNKWRKFILRV